jgi:hypothetical protein
MGLTRMLQVQFAIFLFSPFFMPFSYRSDSVAARTLPNAVGVTGQVTIESCTAACLNAGFSLAGAEYAGQCCTYLLEIFFFFL